MSNTRRGKAAKKKVLKVSERGHHGGRAMRVSEALVARAVATGATGEVRRKNINIDQGQLDAVRELYGLKTETEAVALALGTAIDQAAFEREVLVGFDRLLEHGEFRYVGEREEDLDFSGFYSDRH
jgi:Arc/MetJ family transcription regulator